MGLRYGTREAEGALYEWARTREKPPRSRQPARLAALPNAREGVARRQQHVSPFRVDLGPAGPGLGRRGRRRAGRRRAAARKRTLHTRGPLSVWQGHPGPRVRLGANVWARARGGLLSNKRSWQGAGRAGGARALARRHREAARTRSGARGQGRAGSGPGRVTDFDSPQQLLRPLMCGGQGGRGGC